MLTRPPPCFSFLVVPLTQPLFARVDNVSWGRAGALREDLRNQDLSAIRAVVDAPRLVCVVDAQLVTPWADAQLEAIPAPSVPVADGPIRDVLTQLSMASIFTAARWQGGRWCSLINLTSVARATGGRAGRVTG